jgi:aryl-alcohol dehydrogenase-like predicted oxidoreductase
MDNRDDAAEISRRRNMAHRLALGTAQFGLSYGIANQNGQISPSDAKDILRLARDNGIDTLDTAIAYGSSEECLGNIQTQGFKLVTKLPGLPKEITDVKSWVNELVAASLSRLRVPTLYGILLHFPQDLLTEKGKSLYHALQELQTSGLVEKIGISIYSPKELELLIPRYKFQLIQAPFNLIDRRLSASGWLYRLKDADIEIHTRSAFLQGLLLMRKSAIPDKFSPWADIWNKWHNWLSCHQSISAVQACLAFSLTFMEISRCIIGVDNIQHLQQVIDATTDKISLDFPDLQCDDEKLIYPKHWPNL